MGDTCQYFGYAWCSLRLALVSHPFSSRVRGRDIVKYWIGLGTHLMMAAAIEGKN